MFLDLLIHNNPELLDYSIYLHQKGYIQPDTYVLDRDSILSNYDMISKKAKEYNIDTFVMTKQFGRHPLLLQEFNHRQAKFVAVDFREAQILIQNNCVLAHVGHLVQVPISLIPAIMDHQVEYITVYSLEQAHYINNIAKQKNIIQKILLRVIKTPYEGQVSQHYTNKTLYEFVKNTQELSFVKIVGLTSFPCFKFDELTNKIEATDNAHNLCDSFDYLNNQRCGLYIKNMPSHNCYHNIPQVLELGGKQIEPGHALTGTCPYHAFFPNAQEEKIAMCYISEISHHVDNTSYMFGGGYYRRSNWSHTYTAHDKGISSINNIDPTAIDYTIACEGIHPIGSTTVSSFRSQIFVTRSQVALVKGLSTNTPSLCGIADSQGIII